MSPSREYICYVGDAGYSYIEERKIENSYRCSRIASIHVVAKKLSSATVIGHLHDGVISLYYDQNFFRFSFDI